jgi:hypothetical protein
MSHRDYQFALGVALLLLAPVAAGLDITFTRPTTKTDGSPFAVLFASGFEFRCSAAGTISCPSVTIPAGALAATLAVVIPPSGGTVCIEGRTLGWPSGPWSAAACRSFPPNPPLPSPPGNITFK